MYCLPWPGTRKIQPRHKIDPQLPRKLFIARANQVRAQDTTDILMVFVYLAAVVEFASCRMLAHRVAIALEARRAREVIEQAFARYSTPEIVNTDQGRSRAYPFQGARILSPRTAGYQAKYAKWLKQFHRQVLGQIHNLERAAVAVVRFLHARAPLVKHLFALRLGRLCGWRRNRSRDIAGNPVADTLADADDGDQREHRQSRRAFGHHQLRVQRFRVEGLQ